MVIDGGDSNLAQILDEQGNKSMPENQVGKSVGLIFIANSSCFGFQLPCFDDACLFVEPTPS